MSEIQVREASGFWKSFRALFQYRNKRPLAFRDLIEVFGDLCVAYVIATFWSMSCFFFFVSLSIPYRINSNFVDNIFTVFSMAFISIFFAWFLCLPALIAGFLMALEYREKNVTNIFRWVTTGTLIGALNGLLLPIYLPIFIVSGFIAGFVLWKRS